MNSWQMLSLIFIIGMVQWIAGIWIIERLEKKLNAALIVSDEIVKKLAAMDARLQTITRPDRDLP